MIPPNEKQGVRIKVAGLVEELVRGVQSDGRMSIYARDISDKDPDGNIYGYAHQLYTAYAPQSPAPMQGGCYLDARHLTAPELDAIKELGWYTGRHATALCDYPEFVFADDVLREMRTEAEFDKYYGC